MAPTLDTLLNDFRLARLFSSGASHCALQLWVLQIKFEQSIDNRVVYGRLLPYNHSNNRWSSSDDDNFHTFGQVQAQVIRLNLYIESVHCAELLRQLNDRRNVVEISRDLNLGLSDLLKAKFGTVSLAVGDLIYRPVFYLLNRDAHDQCSLSSPHGGAGAFSASITQVDKGALFRLGQDYDVSLAQLVVKHINADTGLDFGGVDAARFGDLELLVFPALDDLERDLLNVSWTDAPRSLVVRFNPTQVPYFGTFQFRLSIANDGQIAYSGIAKAERNAEDVFECTFKLEDQLHDRIDSTELEIFGFHNDHSHQGTLCCRWRIVLIREVHLQSHIVSHAASSIKFDWLEKTTRPSVSTRVKAALTINRGNLGFHSRVGGREADPWVPTNRDLASLFARLHPLKSDGRFFQRWGQGDHEGRLQFVEWFKALLAKYQQHQIVIFDPYFDAAGLGLILLCAAPTADYIVFRSLPKPVKECNPMRRKSDTTAQEGINNLMANCEQSGHLLQRIKLRIYGLKEGRLHDRYILIMGSDKLPVAGFNLSNSFQTAAQNQPLLITPIPADVLLKVEQYKSGLIREATQLLGEAENFSMRSLFDSTASLAAPRRYEPLLFLENTKAGDVLSAWASEPSLQGLSGGPLKERMVALNLLKDDSLALSDTAGLRNFLDKQRGNFANFTPTWEVLGDVIAHSRTEESHFLELKSERGILEFFVQFLNASFNRTHNQGHKELAVTDARFFRERVEILLHSSYQPHHFNHATKYAALTWSEYFAIKLLWWYASDSLLAIAETQMAYVPIDAKEPDIMRLSLLSQIVSEIALSVQFNISEMQRDGLVRSSNGMLQWMAMNAIERQMDEPGGLVAVRKLVSTFPYLKQVQALGWMVHRASRNSKDANIYNGLVEALLEALPAKIPVDELRHLVDSMRGHMRQLAWAEPWLFQDVIFPLLRNDRANTDNACDIWVEDLVAELKGQPLMFERRREGQMTNITAFLFAHSSPEHQRASLRSIQVILKRQQRIVQRPLASTSDWTRWDDALVISMWILTFALWAQYYLQGRDVISRELDELSRGARELTVGRPKGEWRSMGTGKQGELAAFLDQVEELLASNDE